VEKLNEKWDRRFIDNARLVASWSKDPSTQTGAVIIKPDRSFVSSGFNGFAQGVDDTDERYQKRHELKYRMIIHCEVNAMINTPHKSDIIGSCLYTWPFMSCARCAGVMIQSGIKRVVSKEPKFIDVTAAADPNRWEYEFTLAKAQFEEAGVEIVLYPEDSFDEKLIIG